MHAHIRLNVSNNSLCVFVACQISCVPRTCRVFLGLQTNVTVRENPIVDLGQSKNPRREGDSNLEVEVSRSISTSRKESTAPPHISKGDSQGGQPAQNASAPVAESAWLLSSRGGASSRQAVDLNSVTIAMSGQSSDKVKLTDVRQQLMIMGLFPLDLYGIGETLEEIRLRYSLFCRCSGHRGVGQPLPDINSINRVYKMVFIGDTFSKSVVN